MKLSSLSKTGRWFLAITLLLAIALISIGPSFAAPNAEWPVFVGAALFLLGTVGALRLLTEAPSDDPNTERRAGSKISSSLVALSSAAVLAVYAAGYERTTTAANRFAEQTASPRRRPLPAAALVVSPTAPPQAPQATTALGAPDSAPASSAPVAVVASNTFPAATAGTSEPVASASTPLNEPAAPATTTATPVAALASNNEAPPVASESHVVPSTPAIPAPPKPAGPQTAQYTYEDGAYWGWGSCRHGDLQVQVIIEEGKITSADITKCLTRYPCSMIKEVPPQMVTRQDPDKINNVSGATQSVDAYYEAVIDALNKAVK